MDQFRLLVAATRYSWLARELAQAGVIDVAHDHGLDAPDTASAEGVAWWAPMEHAARLRRAGVDMRLSAPGPTWLARAPQEMTRRSIWAGTVHEYISGEGPESGWTKPAEAKAAGMPAQWFTSRESIIEAAHSAGLTPGSWLQVCPEYLELGQEHRGFAIDGNIVAMCVYLDEDGNTWDTSWGERGDIDSRSAYAFAHECAQSLPLPRGCVIDVAHTSERGWILLEANPVWASNPYGADATAVVHAILAGNSEDPHWAWEADPYLVKEAARKRLLSSRRPTWKPLPAK